MSRVKPPTTGADGPDGRRTGQFEAPDDDGEPRQPPADWMLPAVRYCRTAIIWVTMFAFGFTWLAGPPVLATVAWYIAAPLMLYRGVVLWRYQDAAMAADGVLVRRRWSGTMTEVDSRRRADKVVLGNLFGAPAAVAVGTLLLVYGA